MNSAVKILIVDDAKYFLKQGESFLKRSVCKIFTAGDGVEGLKAVMTERPHIVIMDLKMPNMSGAECCQIIKSHPEYKDLPIIMMANTWDKDAEDKCRLAGCDDFLFKPIKKADFFRTLRKHVHIVERAGHRVPCEGKVVYTFNNFRGEGKVLDISEEGMFINSVYSLDVGAKVDALFKLSPLGDPLKACGKVVRVVSTPDDPSIMRLGMGVKFLETPSEVRRSITKYMSQRTLAA